MSKLYVAYGSNLNLKQMAYRCPTATLVGTGVIENYQLQFKGMPTGAYATIAHCKGKSVPVAVWDIKPIDDDVEQIMVTFEGGYSTDRQGYRLKDGILNIGLRKTSATVLRRLRW